jgi:ribosome-binding factor A
MKAHRTARVAEVVREVAAETILFDLSDPRIKHVTVTRVEVSNDLQNAKVFVSVMGTQKEQDLCMHGLKHSAGYIQSKLASRMKSRFTPIIRFVVDEGVKNSIEVTRLINEALAQSKPTAAQEDSAEGTAHEESEED